MASAALTRAKTALESAKKSASRARMQLREKQSPTGILTMEAPTVIGGGASVGLADRLMPQGIMGAPNAIALAIGFGAAGVASGSPALTRMGIGAAAVAARDYVATSSMLDGLSGLTGSAE